MVWGVSPHKKLTALSRRYELRGACRRAWVDGSGGGADPAPQLVRLCAEKHKRTYVLPSVMFGSSVGLDRRGPRAAGVTGVVDAREKPADG
jgi:hypothetical protein